MSYIPSYRVEFTTDLRAYVTEQSCYGFALGIHPFGVMPSRPTPTAALEAAIEYAEHELNRAKSSMPDLMSRDAMQFNNGIVLLAGQTKALRELLALAAARKQWPAVPIERGDAK